ncbi:MAG: hypothetical protein JW854_06850 [Actinobacteria bacterium]|nr:hypothetical protein [Actinomycetota bacterium]
MPEKALVREFLGKRGYVKVTFFRIRDADTGKEHIRIKGSRRGYRFRGETFADLYSAQRYVADRIAEIDKGSVPPHST